MVACPKSRWGGSYRSDSCRFSKGPFLSRYCQAAILHSTTSFPVSSNSSNNAWIKRLCIFTEPIKSGDLSLVFWFRRNVPIDFVHVAIVPFLLLLMHLQNGPERLDCRSAYPTGSSCCYIYLYDS